MEDPEWAALCGGAVADGQYGDHSECLSTTA